MYRLGEISRQLDCELVGDPELEIVGLCGLSDDLPACLSFVTRARQVAEACRSRIPAFITTREHLCPGKSCIVHPDPDYAIVHVARLFERSRLTTDDEGSVHPTAVVHPSVRLGSEVKIGPHAVVGRDVQIGSRSVIGPGVAVCDRVVLGSDCLVHANAVIREDCVLGNRVILQPGVVIGGDGYGFLQRDGRHVKIPQLGNVVLEDDVEVGANTTIDRGRFSATRVGRGTKVDNLVMIAHNVQTGTDCLLVSQTGISGSTKLGDRVTLAGQVGVAGHMNICSDVTVMGKSAVAKHILHPGTYAGIPIRPFEQWRKTVARIHALTKDPKE